MAAGEAAPAAAGEGLVVGLWLVCLLIVLIGLRAGWEHTLGAILRGLGNAANVGVWKIKLHAGGAFFKLDEVVQDSIGQAILANEKALGLWWHALTQVVDYAADSLAGFSHAVQDTVHNLVSGTIPHIAEAHTKPLTARIGYADAGARARDRAEAKARARGIDATGRDLTAEKLARERGIDNVGARAHGYTDAAVGRVQGAIAAERAFSHRVLGGRLSRLEKLLGVGVIGGIALATLTRVFPYWQCSNVRSFMRGLCRSPLGSLDWLFALAAATVFALDLEEIVHDGQDVANGFAYLWDEIKQQGT